MKKNLEKIELEKKYENLTHRSRENGEKILMARVGTFQH